MSMPVLVPLIADSLKLDKSAKISSQRKAGPCQRQIAHELISEEGVSVSRACRLVSFPRSQFYYSIRKNDNAVITALQELAFKHPDYGFRKLFSYLRMAGHKWNHKRIYRVYKLLKLNKRRKGKRRLPLSFFSVTDGTSCQTAFH